MVFKGTLTVNYPDGEEKYIELDRPMSIWQVLLGTYKLVTREKQLSSFVLTLAKVPHDA